MPNYSLRHGRVLAAIPPIRRFQVRELVLAAGASRHVVYRVLRRLQRLRYVRQRHGGGWQTTALYQRTPPQVLADIYRWSARADRSERLATAAKGRS